MSRVASRVHGRSVTLSSHAPAAHNALNKDVAPPAAELPGSVAAVLAACPEEFSCGCDLRRHRPTHRSPASITAAAAGIRLRAALCYWGLTRSLRAVQPTHEAHLQRVLRAHGIDTRTYVHTWRTANGSQNVWGQALAVRNEPADAKLLAPHIWAEEDEAPFLAKLAAVWPAYYDAVTARRTHAGRVHTLSPDVVRNHLCSLESLRRCYALALSDTSWRPDFVLFVRPDLLLTTDLPVTLLLDLSPNELLVPSTDSWGGVNDRFAAMRAPRAGVYAERISLAAAFRSDRAASSGRIKPETLLKYAADGAGLKPVLLTPNEFCVRIARPDGAVVHASTWRR